MGMASEFHFFTTMCFFQEAHLKARLIHAVLQHTVQQGGKKPLLLFVILTM